MSDNHGNDTDNGDDDAVEFIFGGHDQDNDMLHLTIPELAGARTLAEANVAGSPRARRQAKVMAWTVLLAFAGIPLLIYVISALG